MKKDKKCCEGGNPFIAITGTIGGILTAIIAILLVFAREQVSLIVPIAWALVTLGVLMGFFALKKQ